jgi:hypothetical protein
LSDGIELLSSRRVVTLGASLVPDAALHPTKLSGAPLHGRRSFAAAARCWVW